MPLRIRGAQRDDDYNASTFYAAPSNPTLAYDAPDLAIARADQFGIRIAATVKRLGDCPRLTLLRPSEDPEQGIVEGLAVPYEETSLDRAFSDRVLFRRGAFSASLSSNPDLAVVFPNDNRYIIGRQKSGTAAFWEDSAGVHFQALPPRTGWAKDLLVSVKRRDVSGASALFEVQQSTREWRDGEMVIVVTKARLIWASISPFPDFASAGMELKQQQAMAPAAASFTSEDKQWLSSFGAQAQRFF